MNLITTTGNPITTTIPYISTNNAGFGKIITTNISSGSVISMSSGTSTYTYTSPKTEYIIFGEKVIVDSYFDVNLATCLSSINILGKPFYDDIKKQGYIFCIEIEDVLNKHFLIMERDRKIDNIINEG